MAPTSIDTNTTTTDGSEQTLTTQTTANTYVFVIDTNAMVNGDILEIKIKTIVRASGTERIAYYVSYAHIQGEPIKYSVPVPIDISIKVTLKRVAGSDHAYPWKILSL